MNKIGKAWVRVEGEAWNLTWLIKYIMEKSKRYKVPVQISLAPDSLVVTISIDPFSVAATILIFLISEYLRRRREKLKSKDRVLTGPENKLKDGLLFRHEAMNQLSKKR